ncbi:MAG: hypothetical protein GXO10_04810, partial [Crenarchaeota archaeon]|nr:hypothetical protein [Thermoproteota archaeon]
AIAATIATLMILVAILAYSIRPAIADKPQTPDTKTYVPTEKYASMKPISITVQEGRNMNLGVKDFYLMLGGVHKYLLIIFDQQQLQNFLNQYHGFLVCVKVTERGKVIYYQCKVAEENQQVFFYDVDNMRLLARDPYSALYVHARMVYHGNPVGVLKYAFTEYVRNRIEWADIPVQNSVSITVYLMPSLPPQSS